MHVQIREVDRDQPVQLVEHQLEHRLFLLEKVDHAEPLDHLAHCAERQLLLVAHGKEQVTG